MKEGASVPSSQMTVPFRRNLPNLGIYSSAWKHCGLVAQKDGCGCGVESRVGEVNAFYLLQTKAS